MGALECFDLPGTRGGGKAPVYAWTLPKENTLEEVIGPDSTSYSVLTGWWQQNLP